MISPHWLLVYSFLYAGDSRTVDYTQTLVKKEYCIQIAKDRWREYFQYGIDSQATFTAICTNEGNKYDFVRVICDRNGACNV
jgi:hypothetical protein